jgi:hypothetical protein
MTAETPNRNIHTGATKKKREKVSQPTGALEEAEGKKE